MPEDGTIIVSAPVHNFRCPAAPYERVTMMAHYCAQHKPDASILLLDSKDSFAKQSLFEQGWNRYYEGFVEWLSSDFTDGGVVACSADEMWVETGDGERYEADVINLVPPQQASHLLLDIGYGNEDGWCPVDHQTMLAEGEDRVFIIGDSADALPMPKSAMSANGQAKQVAYYLLNELIVPHIRETGFLESYCWSLLAPGDSIKIGSDFTVSGGSFHPTSPSRSALDDTTDERLTNELEGQVWYNRITSEMFG